MLNLRRLSTVNVTRKRESEVERTQEGRKAKEKMERALTHVVIVFFLTILGERLEVHVDELDGRVAFLQFGGA